MVEQNPFGSFRQQSTYLTRKALEKVYPDLTLPKFMLMTPPNPELGDLSSAVGFELAKKYGVSPNLHASRLSVELSKLKPPIVDRVEAFNGYLNFFVNLPKLSEITIKAAETLGSEYGFVKAENPERIIVEHTSANPSGPLHIGTARNAILGDVLSNILRARGNDVKRHFYVDDVGKQVALAAYAYKILGEPEIKGKPDKWIGFIYAAINSTISIKALKEKIRASQDPEEAELLKRQLDDYVAVASELESQSKDEFLAIWNAIQSEASPDVEVEILMREYEKGELSVKKIFMKLVEACLSGFRETLRKARIEFDSWDWESMLVWSSQVSDVLKKLNETPFTFQSQGAIIFNADLAAKKLGVKAKLFGDPRYEVPNLILIRSDGTTLYTTRDIAYHLNKFSWADKAVNVVGVDQKLAQLQLKIALLAIGLHKALDSLIHYAYELVTLPGYRMSRRKGRYISFDELIAEAVSNAYREVVERSGDMAESEKNKIAEAVGLGAIKMSMLSVSAVKTLNFSWEKALNFEANSAPYVQYAHARAESIMRKAEFIPENPDYSLLNHPLEKALVVRLAKFPEVFIEAAESLKPELLVEYANDLADDFNVFYAKLPVLKADGAGLKDARLKIVKTSAVVLENALGLQGIDAPDKM